MKTYLGDSIYVETPVAGDLHMLKTYLDNGLGPHTTIVYDPETFLALILFACRRGFISPEQIKDSIDLYLEKYTNERSGG